ncbi:MAG: hypothetical protein HYV09_12170 [Deltaproteobacteria bacterium]|nr:hypothetical protein [Deltaproteobacteria bacterium]
MRLALLAVFLIGCGKVSEDAPDADAGSDGAADAPAITLEAACTTRADALCRDFAACAGLSLRRWYADEAACRAGARRLCVRDSALPGVVDPVPKVLACAAALVEEPCGVRGALPTLFCGPARTRGALDEGAGCWFDEQCEGGLCAHGIELPSPLDLPSCGTCARAAAPGDPCSADRSAACDPISSTLRSSNLACDPATKTCVARAAAGAPCPFPDACARGLACSGGVCVAPTARLGDACRPVGGCAEGFCNEGRCAPWSEAYGAIWPKLVGVGEECDDTRQCLAGAWCSSSTRPFVCVAPLPLGARCPGAISCGHLAACMRPEGEPRSCIDRRPECPRPPA